MVTTMVRSDRLVQSLVLLPTLLTWLAPVMWMIFLVVTAVPSAKSSIKPGDRVLEINGVPCSEFKGEKSTNELFDKVVLDIIPGDEEEDDDSDDEEVEVEDVDDEDID